MNKYTFFFNGPFSQWHPAKFIIDNVAYNCAEQYMMAEKARLFEDDESLRIIMSCRDPWFQKRQGRLVKGFDKDAWHQESKLIVYRGNLAKFKQNPDLWRTLAKTQGSTLVEASPTDRIWGIGLSEDDPKRFDEKSWNGLNWLGEILTKVRDDMMRFKLSSGAMQEHYA